MASALRFLTCLALTVYIVASVGAAISCGRVASNVSPCVLYLQGRGLSPLCCRGLRDLNATAQTTQDRQETCLCLRGLAKVISGFDPIRASELPGKCRVSLPFPISPNANCTQEKNCENVTEVELILSS